VSRGALAQHAEQTLERIGLEREPLVRELFRNLVTAQWTRAVADREELLSVLPDREAGARVLDQLIDARLLTSYEVREAEGGARRDSSGARAREETKAERSSEALSAAISVSRQRIEIVHESLLRAWPRLVRWQAQDEEGAVLRNQLKQAARLWEEKSRPDDLLWTGTSEREFELWRERYPGALTKVEDEFAAAMVQRSRRRKRLLRLAVAAVVLGLSVVAGMIAVSRQREAEARREAEAAELLALGRLQLEGHPTAALAYDLASLELADTPAARRFAVEALGRGAAAFILPGSSQSVDFSPDGRWLAVGGTGHGVRLWSRDGGAPTQIAVGSAGIPSVQFDPQGPLLQVRDPEAVRIFSVEQGEAPRLLETEVVRKDTSWSVLRNSRLLTFTNGPRTTVTVRPVGESEGRLLGRWNSQDVAWWEVSSTGDALAYARGRRISLQSLQDLDSAPRLVGEHSGAAVARLRFGPGDDRLVSVDESGEIRIWVEEEDGWALERSLDSDLEQPMVYVDRSGSVLVVVGTGISSGGDAVRVWDLRGPPDAGPLALPNADLPLSNGGALDPGGEWLATANGTAVVLRPLDSRRGRVLQREGRPLSDVAFTPDGRWLASTSPPEIVVRLWPLSPHAALERRDLLVSGEPSPRFPIAVHPDGRHVLVVSYAGQAVLVPTEGGRPRVLERSSMAMLDSPAFSRDGRYAAFGARNRPGGNVIELWDLRSGEARTLDPSPSEGESECGVGPYMESAVAGVAFTSDGRLLSAGFSGLRLWNLDDGTNRLLRPCAPEKPIQLLGGSAVDRFLLADTNNVLNESVLTFHDLAAGTSRELSSHGNAVWSVALDSSGEIAVTGSFDGLVRVGTVDDAEPHLLYGHGAEVFSLAVSPDGRWIASASVDGTIRLWPMPTGPPLHTLPYAELLARLRSFTNLRVVRDEGTETGYRVEVPASETPMSAVRAPSGPFPGWAVQPEW
jgi:WD40 repeat protein